MNAMEDNSDGWSLSICHIDENKEIQDKPTLTANLSDFVKFKKSRPPPPQKPVVAVKNRFLALEEENEVKELTLDDGVVVDEIKPKALKDNKQVNKVTLDDIEHGSEE